MLASSNIIWNRDEMALYIALPVYIISIASCTVPRVEKDEADLARRMCLNWA